MEIGINRSKVFNTKQIVSSTISTGFQATIADIITESPSYTNNYSMSVGLRIWKNHHLRMRYSSNTLGSYLFGSLRVINDTGSFNDIKLNNSHNAIQNTTYGIIYEFNPTIYEHKFTFDVGFEKQKNDFTETIFHVPGLYFDNYAVHASIGMLHPLFNIVLLHTKVFGTYSFANKTKINIVQGKSEYIPLQVGIEIGLRIALYK